MRLIKDTGHSRKYGTFTIGIACSLAKAGLDVHFYTDADPDMKPLERRLYKTAQKLGVAILPAVNVSVLLASRQMGGLPIVFYDTASGCGHFSPLLEKRGRKLVLPHDDQGGMSRTKFEEAWAAPGICRQAVVAYAI